MASSSRAGDAGRTRSRSSSPEVDSDVLAYIQAQQAQDTSALTPAELKHAAQLKMDRFQHGASKTKSRVQRDREEAERKKKQAELDAAAAYAEFVAAMGGNEDRGEGRQSGTAGFVAAGGKAYVGSRLPESSAKRPNAFEDADDDAESELAEARKDPAVKRKRAAMDSFLTELQTQQAERESRLSATASSSGTSISTLLAHEGAKPARTAPQDPQTTNICVLNMPASTTEPGMAEFFARYGDVATVKVMWPRAGADRSGLTGFVAYMQRSDAERAFAQCDGAMWGPSRIKLSWGKSMVLPPQALYPKTSEWRSTEPAGDAVMRSNANLVIRPRRARLPADTLAKLLDAQSSDGSRRAFIETVAARVRTHGPSFEAHLRGQEAGNAQFAFLDEPESAACQYYRLCVDPSYTPVLPPAPFAEDGSESDYYSTDSGEESERGRLGRRNTLGPRAQARLHAMLRNLTLRRERIARVMAFALDHAGAHEQIVDILVTAVLQPRTPVPRKLARLYCLSDVLHNSGTAVPNAWKYRSALEARLPLVFAHFAQVVHAYPGRMKQEAIKAQLANLLHVWESWLVVSPPVMAQLRQLLNAPKPTPLPQTEPEDIDGEDLDGEAM